MHGGGGGVEHIGISKRMGGCTAYWNFQTHGGGRAYWNFQTHGGVEHIGISKRMGGG